MNYSDNESIYTTVIVIISIYCFLLVMDVLLVVMQIRDKQGRSPVGLRCMILQSLLCIFKIVGSLAAVSKELSDTRVCQYISTWGDMCELCSLCLLSFSWFKIVRVFYAKKRFGTSYRPDNARVVSIIMWLLLSIVVIMQIIFSFLYWIYYSNSWHGNAYTLYLLVAMVLFGTLMLVFGAVLQIRLKKDGEKHHSYAARITKTVSVIGAVISLFLSTSVYFLITKENIWSSFAQNITQIICEIAVGSCYIYFFGWKYLPLLLVRPGNLAQVEDEFASSI